MSIGERIKSLRSQLGLTQAKFGEPLGVSDKAVSTWETGRHKPKIGDIEMIHQVYDVSKKWLLDGENEVELPKNLIPISKLRTQRVPLLGEVAAGQPIYCDQRYDTYVTSPLECDAALEIHGDSMEPTYLDGDLIYIKCQPDVYNGGVAVVIIDNAATVKHVYHTKHGLTLVSDNPAYEPMHVDYDEHEYVAIFGIPVGYTRIYRP